MDRQSSSNGMRGLFRFLPAEVKEMEERLLKPFISSARWRDHALIHELAAKFSNSRDHAGMVPVNPQQVLNWFYNNRNKKTDTKIETGAQVPRSIMSFRANHQQGVQTQGNMTLFGAVFQHGVLAPGNMTAFGTYHQQAAGQSSKSQLSAPVHAGFNFLGKNPMVGDQDFRYEAMSARNGAWYDAHDFLSHRPCESGDLEVLVHLSDSGTGEAEWINACTCLRQRSVPYKPTECKDVKPWDPVLCYKLTQTSGLYFDAEMARVWMYNWPWMERPYCDEVDKFIEAAKKDATLFGSITVSKKDLEM
ncbi:hypothetical protein U9M48_028362 [Paspalum notatum var. saurae]|uniref:SAWADEE domain-containing protein n=1 Tax=Paspalum notatum var. saurae TaxID=547442 RepID=A0AAQ3TX26_PASNO